MTQEQPSPIPRTALPEARPATDAAPRFYESSMVEWPFFTNGSGGLAMSLHPQDHFPVPEETRRVAESAFPKGALCLRIGDHLGMIYQDRQFAALFPARGQPAEAPARLALVTVLQFVEGLSDRQAADAVRGRIDWKYVLALELTDPGFDFSVLSEFRVRLLAEGMEGMLLNTLLSRLQDLGLLKARGRQRTDSTHVLAAVRVLNRLERVGETLRAALNSLAEVSPEWLRAFAPEAWYGRYGRRVEDYQFPKAEAARQELAASIGADGQDLLDAIEATPDGAWLGKVPAVELLRRVWAEQYLEDQGKLRWRTVEERLPSAELITSPYDPDARYSAKRSMEWVGYKVHFTEACDPEAPRLIVNVETTPASTSEEHMVATIHAPWPSKGACPGSTW